MYAVPSAVNVVQVTYTRSRNRLPRWLSTVRSCLSRKGTVPVPATSGSSMATRAGNVYDAPPLPVDRSTTSALDRSGLAPTAVGARVAEAAAVTAPVVVGAAQQSAATERVLGQVRLVLRLRAAGEVGIAHVLA